MGNFGIYKDLVISCTRDDHPKGWESWHLVMSVKNKIIIDDYFSTQTSAMLRAMLELEKLGAIRIVKW